MSLDAKPEKWISGHPNLLVCDWTTKLTPISCGWRFAVRLASGVRLECVLSLFNTNHYYNMLILKYQTIQDPVVNHDIARPPCTVCNKNVFLRFKPSSLHPPCFSARRISFFAARHAASLTGRSWFCSIHDIGVEQQPYPAG